MGKMACVLLAALAVGGCYKNGCWLLAK